MSVVSDRVALNRNNLKLGGFVVFGLAFLALALPAFLEPMTFWIGIVLGDYAYPTHELHHFLLGTYLGLLFLGVVAQAVYPSKRVGALHGTIVLFAAAVIGVTLTDGFDPILLLLLGLLVGMTLTHPVGTAQLPSRENFDSLLGALALVTLIGGLAFAGIEWNAQLTAEDAHVVFGHYIFTGAAGLSVGVLAIYGSLRGINWRHPIYSASVLILVLGVASMVYPSAAQGSSFGVIGGILVALWALVLVLVAERNAIQKRL